MPGCGFHGRTHVAGAGGSMPRNGWPSAPTGMGARTTAPPGSGRTGKLIETGAVDAGKGRVEARWRVIGYLAQFGDGTPEYVQVFPALLVLTWAVRPVVAEVTVPVWLAGAPFAAGT